MIAFYITCAIFIVGILGTLLYAVARVNIFSLMKYLAREYLLIVGTSSSESALPRLIAKMEHLGVAQAGRRHHRSDRLLVQPRRHRDLPHDGVAVHRRRHGHADVDPRADRPAAVHGHRLEGRRGRHRRRAGHPRRRSAGLPPRPGQRRRRDRRDRPLHVGGPRDHELHRQRRGHGADRHLGQGVRLRPRRVRCSAARSRSTRRRCRATTTTACPTQKDAVGTQGLEEAAVVEAEAKEERAREREAALRS